ncbi:NUDIX domain-containing protein [Sporosarcina sp.]|uniref:NUDIX hydrolase n=1 Tax=Sporosarcina sp. TaxID=49982 RepID=UPI00260CCF92|nr:NUDIX domain-containing protein [Sporosarcina sp.]
MEEIKIFDENYTYLRNESRDTAHREGHWHETIHCWLIDGQSVYLQKRSCEKKDFPSLFDITAAGHILADETVEDGLREVNEELGIDVDHTKLQAQGAVKDIIELPDFHDYEFANVFLYEDTFAPADFVLQKDEVEGIYTVRKDLFIQLCSQEIRKVTCQNIRSGESTDIGLEHFVPHEASYFKQIAVFLTT